MERAGLPAGGLRHKAAVGEAPLTTESSESSRLIPSVTSAGAKQSPWERAGWVLFALALLAGFPIALYRAANNTGGTDFPEFYAAGRYVLEHRQLEPTAFLKYYWPSLDVAWAALAWMPLPVAAAVWYAIGCGAWLGLLRTTERYFLSDLEQPLRRQAMLAAGLLMTPLVLDHLCLGAFHLLMVWLMVAGLARASRGRDWSGGALLGLAVWIKLLPLLGVGYLVLKRKWRPAAIAVASAVLVDVALAVPVVGPQQAWQAHLKWWENQAAGASERILTRRDSIGEDRLTNQSPAILIRRLLTHLGHYPGCPWEKVALADLSAGQFRLVYYGVLGVLGLGVLAVCRRPGRVLAETDWATEIALIALATLWFSPVAWSYHPTSATPALAVVVGRKRPPWLAWTTVALWLLAMVLMGSPLARAVGEMFWATLVLGVLLVATAPDPRAGSAGPGVADDRL